MPAPPEVIGDVAGQMVDRCLRRRVRRHPELVFSPAIELTLRTAPPPRCDMCGAQLGEAEQREDVQPVKAHSKSAIGMSKASATAAGVVDQHVHAAEQLDRRTNKPVEVVLGGDVTRHTTASPRLQ